MSHELEITQGIDGGEKLCINQVESTGQQSYDPYLYYASSVEVSHLFYFFKRVIDICLSLFSLLLFLPLALIIILFIKIDSRGPVFIRQQRIGKTRRLHTDVLSGKDERRKRDLFGEPISIYKFRTMYSDVDLYAVTPNNNSDKRITRCGKILRRLGLDELPQLLNVLRGEMSIVGPRPEMPFLVSQYNALERCRLLEKPGITGYWQIHAPRDMHIHESLQYDLFYIKNKSMLFDVKIMLKTVMYILSMKNN